MDRSLLPIVMIAGTMATKDCWQLQYGALSPRPLIFPTAHLGCVSIREMATAVLAHAPARFDLVAWSMGGYIALEVLLAEPDRVRRAVLISTSSRAESPCARTRRSQGRQDAAKLGLRRACRAALDRAIVQSDSVDSKFLDDMAAAAEGLGWDIFDAQSRAIMNRRDLTPMLSAIQHPVLVMAGADDPIISPSHSRDLARGLPLAEWQLVEGAGHCLPWERHQLVNGRLRAFLGWTKPSAKLDESIRPIETNP